MADRRVPLASIPSPPASGLYLGPLDVHVYGLMHVVGIALASWITIRRWEAAAGNRALVSSGWSWLVSCAVLVMTPAANWAARP